MFKLRNNATTLIVEPNFQANLKLNNRSMSK